MSTPKVRKFAAALVETYISYGFSDWSQAVKDVEEYLENMEGLHFTDSEIADAETIARRVADKWRPDYDGM